MTNSNLNILIINGSHRAEKGITEVVLRKFIKGAETADTLCQLIYPAKQKIIPCESCDKCLFGTPGECKYKDDMGSIISKIDEADLVVGPSSDGGYYLIGMNKPNPNLFDGILWSTDVVYKQTIFKASELGLRTIDLRTIDDIDTEEDFHRWLKRPDRTKSGYIGLEDRVW